MSRSNKQIEKDILLLEQQMKELIAIEESIGVPPLTDNFNRGPRNKIRSVRRAIITLINKLN